MNPVIMLNYQNKKEENSEQMEDYKKREREEENGKWYENIHSENSNGNDKDMKKREGRKSRSLLQYVEGEKMIRKRREKFIRNFPTGGAAGGENWTKELSEMTDKDLENQKIKTLNYYRNKNYTNNGNDVTIDKNKTLGSDVIILKRLKKREKSSEELSNEKKTGNETTDSISGFFKPYENSLNEVQMTMKNYNNSENFFKNFHWLYKNTTTKYYDNLPNVTKIFEETSNDTTTPRINKRSDSTNEIFLTTSLHPVTEMNAKIESDDYNNSVPSSNQIQNVGSYETKQQPEIDNYNSIKITTEVPFYYTSSFPPSYQQFYREGQLRTKYSPYRNRNKQQQFPVRYNNRQQQPPIRRINNNNNNNDQNGNYYRREVVIARYPTEEETEFDLIKFFWSLITSFTKPFTKLLMPNLSKEGTDEPQCYELLVCEAQRASKLMGPTAETLAATIGYVFINHVISFPVRVT